MAASNPAQYAKLGKEEGEQSDAKNIRPGELNQPVRVPELELKRCVTCWQVLPPDFEPPLDEAWGPGLPASSGVLKTPRAVCWTGLLCPCVLFGRNAEALRGVPWMRACTCHAICVEGGIALAILTAVFHGVLTPDWISYIGEGLWNGWILCSAFYFLRARESLQKKYHLKNSPCNPWPVHCCLHCCANCQEHREMKARLPARSVAPATIVNPPPVQEMSMGEIHPSAAAPEKEAPKAGHDNVEVVPL
ncbi:hypothetical protein EJB05_23389 [Eragrostis curvula]|uniref:Cell number regulator 6 n=1 Tax=Eragrostis curvula TaxID=38414 RepID=A0A5J9V892_9POAL|nr:hypothetical protein EJB05_23389 [Eragrostis curvula]